jgi:hypothetical protein
VPWPRIYPCNRRSGREILTRLPHLAGQYFVDFVPGKIPHGHKVGNTGDSPESTYRMLRLVFYSNQIDRPQGDPQSGLMQTVIRLTYGEPNLWNDAPVL